MLKVADSSSFSPELTSEDKLPCNEERDKNSSLPFPTTKRLLKKLQGLPLLSGDKTLQQQCERKRGEKARMKRQENPQVKDWNGNGRNERLEVSHQYFQQLAPSHWASHVKYFLCEQ